MLILGGHPSLKPQRLFKDKLPDWIGRNCIVPRHQGEIVGILITHRRLLLAGFIVAAGQLSMTFAYRHLEVSKEASMQLLLPTGVGAWLLCGELFGPVALLGASLTVVATLIINRRASKPIPKTVTPQPTRP